MQIAANLDPCTLTKGSDCMSTQQIRDEVLSSPLAEQLALLRGLQELIPVPTILEANKLWLAEAARRDSELDAHPELEVSHQEMMRTLRR